MSTAAAIAAAFEPLREFATLDEPLAPFTTYKLGGPAAIMATPRGEAELLLVGELARVHSLPLLIVGRGSNLLVADGGFDGIAVSLSAMADDVAFDDAVVEAGAAVALPVLSRRCSAAGLVGFEWAVGVPGSIGGAVRMNAGGHGSDMANCLLVARVVDLRSARSRWLTPDELGLRFRGSGLADHQVVTTARLQLEHGDPAESEAQLAEIVRWRREHQPGGQNAGSVFVNPVPGEVPAAALIDRLGLKGRRVGGAWVSEKHANFIQAGPDATAADVRELMEIVRAEVAEHTGIVMRSEIRLIGFADVADDAGVGVLV
ncbi:MAG TPA: UDP-N-acetylmuramate dehydrogenase [Ilumatobacteraceae bacterium]|nr:UDP-N-acetylmuramate dehydrogenase [Ilumatobacteraceae bacterium]